LREGVFPSQIAGFLKKCTKFILAKVFFSSQMETAKHCFFHTPLKNSAHCAFFDTIYPKKGGIIDVFSPFDYYWGPWGWGRGCP